MNRKGGKKMEEYEVVAKEVDELLIKLSKEKPRKNRESKGIENYQSEIDKIIIQNIC
jgi:hypothetical protein